MASLGLGGPARQGAHTTSGYEILPSVNHAGRFARSGPRIHYWIRTDSIL